MLLDMQNINKSFFGVKVLDGVNFHLGHGEVHALIGGNGAGKSTLVKMISGFHQPDEGEISIEGKRVHINSSIEAQQLGVSIIYQDPALVQDMSIAENIFLGVEPRVFGLFANHRKMKRDARDIMKSLGYMHHPGTLVRHLSLSEQHAVAIAKAISKRARILIMDEPTASLTDMERERLFLLIRSFKEEGIGIIYITHRLEELHNICDRITILRDGKHVITRDLKGLGENDVIRFMLGRELKYLFPQVTHEKGKELLSVKGLTRKPWFTNIQFQLYEGEILGFAGLVGSGRTELAKTIFGELKRDSGEVIWKGKEVRFRGPREAIQHRFGFVNRDRLGKGLFPDMNISQNLTISGLDHLHKWQFLLFKEEQDKALDAILQLSINIQGPDQKVKYLSGGNQQKVTLGRWLVADCDLYFLDEPTQSIDVGAKTEMYASIHDLVEAGKGMIIISSDLSELLGICTRILVMHEGHIVDEMTRMEATEERITQSASGMTGTPRSEAQEIE
ncbi:ATP-binding cassette domain-containing protein [Paenibacillus sp. LMG 31457]|uniref:ATP-binding cassette domain-containing protein n=2 Tax=Paenibacillus planticolens TaxID=2654976 RepID=A0ABX1ZME1_9BACL|nr:ATP-binding cassette domain-containing protein [Paenibacillus planticolens]